MKKNFGFKNFYDNNLDRPESVGKHEKVAKMERKDNTELESREPESIGKHGKVSKMERRDKTELEGEKKPRVTKSGRTVKGIQRLNL